MRTRRRRFIREISKIFLASGFVSVAQSTGRSSPVGCTSMRHLIGHSIDRTFDQSSRYFALETGAAHVKAPCEKFKSRWRQRVFQAFESAGSVFAEEVQASAPNRSAPSNDHSKVDSKGAECAPISYEDEFSDVKRARRESERWHSFRIQAVKQVNKDSFVFTLEGEAPWTYKYDQPSTLWHVDLQLASGSDLPPIVRPIEHSISIDRQFKQKMH